MSKVNRLILGITGGLATGKTTVMRILAGRGIPTISSDAIAHASIRRGRPAYKAVLRSFGQGILDSTGQISRQKLGEIVFASPRKRKILEKIIHPYVSKDLKAFIERHPTGIIALDIPLLFEAHLAGLVDKSVVVSSSRASQIRRFCRRTGLSRTQALARIKTQLPLPNKRRLADIVVHNTGSLERLRRQVLRIIGH